VQQGGRPAEVPLLSAIPGTRGFVGGTNDPTGLVHLGAREYDPTLGRFQRPEGPAWYATPTVAYAAELGYEVRPIEAYVRYENGRYLDGWYQRLRDASLATMADLGVHADMAPADFLAAMGGYKERDPDLAIVVSAIKATVKAGIGKLRERPRGEGWRPGEPWRALSRPTGGRTSARRSSPAPGSTAPQDRQGQVLGGKLVVRDAGQGSHVVRRPHSDPVLGRFHAVPGPVFVDGDADVVAPFVGQPTACPRPRNDLLAAGQEDPHAPGCGPGAARSRVRGLDRHARDAKL
jgi:hypothetical protein